MYADDMVLHSSHNILYKMLVFCERLNNDVKVVKIDLKIKKKPFFFRNGPIIFCQIE